MPPTPPSPPAPPSFSPGRKWGVGMHVVLLTLVVLAVVVMVNYISRDHFFRFHLSSLGRITLAPRTLSLVRSLTNRVDVTLYYDRDDYLYSMVSDLLKEYQLANSIIHLKTVDYLRDPGAAIALKQKYHLLAEPNAKNYIIFDCEGRVKAVDGNSLAKYVLEQVPNEKEKEFRRKPVAFEGERMFTGTLLAITSPKPLKAYFLQSEGENSITSSDERFGLTKFVSVLQQNYIQPARLSLTTNSVPADCSLLVIPGPADEFSDTALANLEQYLVQGGRLLVLFDFRSLQKPTGLEPVLARWGVGVGTNIIKDPENFTQANLMDMKVGIFGKHPVVNSLQDLQLHMIYPRSIFPLQARSQADAPGVEPLAFSGPKSFADGNPALGEKSFPLIVAVEKGAIKGVVTERGTTRMVVAGDSIFLANHYIDSAANRDFAAAAVNWLVDRPQLLDGVGPRRIDLYSISMTRVQQQRAQWLLLGGMPGSVLALGSLVWLRRRR